MEMEEGARRAVPDFAGIRRGCAPRRGRITAAIRRCMPRRLVCFSNAASCCWPRFLLEGMQGGKAALWILSPCS